MAFPATYRAIVWIRLLLSVLISIIIHGAIFLLLDYFIVFASAEPPQHFEPLVIQLSSLGSAPVSEQSSTEPIPDAPAEPPPVEPAAEGRIEPKEAAPPETAVPTAVSRPESEPTDSSNKTTGAVEAASPWGSLTERPDATLAGDPYGDLPTRETGGLRIEGKETADTSRPADEPTLPASTGRFFTSDPMARDETEGVMAESRPAADGEAAAALQGELLNALDRSYADRPKVVAEPEVMPEEEESEDGGDSLVKWDEEGTGRQLLLAVSPDLSEIERLDTPVLHIYAEIEVVPDGMVSRVAILESSGISEVDAAVRIALSLWRFQQVGSQEGSIRGKIRYTITAVAE